MRSALLLSAMLLGGIATTTLLESEALACGGCFAPPENPTVVTDHRMILSVSKAQTTLYDQIRYQGDPGSFAWVLPIAGTVEVGLSSDALFGVLDQQTQTQIVAPPRNCPPRPSDCDDSRNANFGAASAAPSEDGVDVLKRETVGPYETVQLRSTDPQALEAWLAKNGFSIPDAVKPVLAKYIGEKFDFLALKLVPGKGVNDMRPVRVTTPGAAAVLPLRMVAAGAGANVGITLWVVGEGRYEPQNFPSFIIPQEELSWNWAQNRSNYTELRAQKTAAGAGRIWELESSTGLERSGFESQVTWATQAQVYLPNGGSQPAPGGYTPITDGQGTTTKSADEARDEDLQAFFAGIPGAARVTRLRADLAFAALDADLNVIASQDQSVLSTTRQVTRESDQPQCTVWVGCSSDGQAPRDEAIARSSPSGGLFGSSCATTPHTGGNGWLAAGAGFATLALVNAVRKRARRAR